MPKEFVSEQEVIKVLRQEELRLSTCLSDNGCMTEGCPKGNNPVDCLDQLEAARNSIDLVNQTIASTAPETWSGEYSVKSANNPGR